MLRLLRGGFAGLQENLGGTADQVAALLLEPGLALGHLIPDTAEGVVGEELDDVARGEELVADGQLAAVARRGGFLAHLLPLGGVVVILVDPADGFVLGPEGIEVGGVEEVEQVQQGGLAGEEQTLGRAAVEEHAEIDGQFIEEAEEVAAIAVVGVAQAGTGHLLKDLEPLGLVALADRFDNEAALFRHADGGQAVEDGECLLAGKAGTAALVPSLSFGMGLNEIVDPLPQQGGGGQARCRPDGRVGRAG